MSASEELKALETRFREVDPSLSSTRRRQRRLTATEPVMAALPQIVAVVEWAERVHDEPYDFAAGVGWRPLGDALTALEEALGGDVT